MSIFTRFGTAAVIIAALAASGIATPAAAKDYRLNYAPNTGSTWQQQADRNRDGRLSAQEMQWARSRGLKPQAMNPYGRPYQWRQNNAGTWVRVYSHRNSWRQPNAQTRVPAGTLSPGSHIPGLN